MYNGEQIGPRVRSPLQPYGESIFVPWCNDFQSYTHTQSMARKALHPSFLCQREETYQITLVTKLLFFFSFESGIASLAL